MESEHHHQVGVSAARLSEAILSAAAGARPPIPGQLELFTRTEDTGGVLSVEDFERAMDLIGS